MRVDVGRVGDVALDEGRVGLVLSHDLQGLLGPFDVATVVDKHGRAGLGKVGGDRQADALRGAGDQRDLPVEPHHEALRGRGSGECGGVRKAPYRFHGTEVACGAERLASQAGEYPAGPDLDELRGPQAGQPLRHRVPAHRTGDLLNELGAVLLDIGDGLASDAGDERNARRFEGRLPQ